MVWELTAEAWSDQHPHVEYNYVLEGQLFVDIGDETVTVRQGEVVRVPPGVMARYWAPQCAKLLALFGAHPDGGGSVYAGYESLR